MLKTFLIIFFLFSVNLCALEFKVATYNVENLFDLKHDGNEYESYIPNTNTNWNKTTYTKKLNNLAQVISHINADIIALQEVESKEALSQLTKKLKDYKYSAFSKNRNSSVGMAILSRFPITKNERIHVAHAKVNRPIQKVTLNIDDKTFILFNNHWPSKRKAENERIRYAK